MIQTGKDKELLEAIGKGCLNTVVWFDARSWIKVNRNLWKRYNVSKRKIKKNLPGKSQEQIMNDALDWVNGTEFDNH